MARRRVTDGYQWLEWALGIVSGVAVLAIVAYLAIEGFTSGEEAPELTIAPDASGEATPGRLPFVVRNEGGRAAVAVVVGLETRRDGGRDVQRLEIDEIPAGSEATGAFILPPGSEAAPGELRIEGYLDP